MDLDLIKRLSRDNASWVLPSIFVIGVIATFALGGVVGGLIGIGVFVVLAIASLLRSLMLAQQQLTTVTEEEEGEDSQEEQGFELSNGNPEASQGAERPPSKPEDIESQQAADTDPPVFQAIRAASDGKSAEVRAVLDPWVEEVEGNEKVSRRAFRLRTLLMAGDRSALEELRRLADDHEDLHEPTLSLAYALASLGERQQALQELDKRIPRVRAEGQPRLRVVKAGFLRESGDAKGAIAEARTLARDSEEVPAVLAEALQEEGLALEALERPVDALAAFERSLSADPTNDWLRFHSAYLYADVGLADLSALHYKILTDQRPDHPNAENNLAVRFESLDLSLSAMKGYKRSAERDESLSAANLANALIGAGFEDEAIEWIERGEAMDSPHENLAHARTRLAEVRSNEETAIRAMIERGESGRKVVLAFRSESGDEPLEGRWQFDTGDEVELSRDGLTWSGESKNFSVVIEPSGSVLSASVSRGALLGRSTHQGWGTLADGHLHFVMLDWPSKGMQSVLRAERMESTLIEAPPSGG